MISAPFRYSSKYSHHWSGNIPLLKGTGRVSSFIKGAIFFSFAGSVVTASVMTSVCLLGLVSTSCACVAPFLASLAACFAAARPLVVTPGVI